MQLASGERQREQYRTTQHHLRPRRERQRSRPGHGAGQHRPERPGDAAGEDREAGKDRERLLIALEEEPCDCAEAQRDRAEQSPAERLMAEYEHLEADGRERQRGLDHRGQPRGYVLLGPEQRAVGGDKQKQRRERDAAPFAAARCRVSAQAHPGVEQRPRSEKAHPGGEERRDLQHRDADREEGRAPQQVDRREGQRHARVGPPRRASQSGFHNLCNLHRRL
jgi:hypothetical protein